MVHFRVLCPAKEYLNLLLAVINTNVTDVDFGEKQIIRTGENAI